MFRLMLHLLQNMPESENLLNRKWINAKLEQEQFVLFRMDDDIDGVMNGNECSSWRKHVLLYGNN